MSEAGDSEVATAQIFALIERRRFDEARARLAAPLGARPDDAELLFASAYIDYLTDRNDDALATTRSILKSDPHHCGARSLQAQLLDDMKKYAQAEQLWIGLLRDFPEDPDYYASYASLMLRTMQLEKARRLAAEGLRLEPDHEGCLFTLSLADLVTGNARTGSENLATLVSRHPENTRTALALVITLEDRGDTRAALRVAQELLRSRPDSAEFLELVRAFKMQTHWSMLPLYPMRRWGWGASAALWAVAVVGFRAMSGKVPGPVITGIAVVWLVYVLYSWIWPSMLKKFI